MDPLSILVSIVTLIDATQRVVKTCYNYAARFKEAPLALCGLIEELNGLRRILQSIEQLSRSNNNSNPAFVQRLEYVRYLSDAANGPIAKQLEDLMQRIRPPKWMGRDRSKPKAFMHSLTWPLKENETRRTLENISRLKSTLELALTTDHM
ncbi:MAG: hypothetical protein Q9219_001258 [cf. Caloplaca sp. 3 TL-2023]